MLNHLENHSLTVIALSFLIYIGREDLVKSICLRSQQWNDKATETLDYQHI